MMDISINGKTADITLESERTIGEVLSGIDSWLRSSGFRLKGLEIDGELVDSGSVPRVFERELGGIRAMDIKVCAGSELALDALCDAVSCLATYGAAWEEGNEAEMVRIAGIWSGSAAASFLAAEFPELNGELDAVFTAFAGKTRIDAIKMIIEERIRELADPGEEISRLQALTGSVAGRLEDLPLDIQTGKDSRAAETAALFSATAEKLFRLYRILKIRGGDFSGIELNSVPLETFLEEFDGAVKEMLAAYQSRDLVLVGDLAEYELAPRLRSFQDALTTVKDRA
jgi:hypothetical protein